MGIDEGVELTAQPLLSYFIFIYDNMITKFPSLENLESLLTHMCVSTSSFYRNRLYHPNFSDFFSFQNSYTISIYKEKSRWGIDSKTLKNKENECYAVMADYGTNQFTMPYLNPLFLTAAIQGE